MFRLDQRINLGVDKWFVWGFVAGIFVVYRFAQIGVPGFALYSWTIPLVLALLYSEDNWHIISCLMIISSGM
jgi:hypothetical protein